MNKLNSITPFLKLSPKRRKILFLIVFLSMTFITLFSFLVQSSAKSYLEFQRRQYGEQHATFYNLTLSQADSLKNHSLVKQYGVATSIGSISKSLKWGEGKITIGFFDEMFIKLKRIEAIKGRMPQASDEVAITRKSLDLIGNNIKLNSYVEIPAEYRNNDGSVIKETKRYKVVGIISQDRKGYDNRNNIKDFYIPSVIIHQTEFDRLSEFCKSSYSVVTKNQSNSPETFREIEAGLSLLDHASYNHVVYQFSGLISISYHLLVNTGSFEGKWLLFLVTFVVSTILSLVSIIFLEFNHHKQQIALVKALGGTSKQLAVIMTRSTLPVLCKAIPLGVGAGIGLSKLSYIYLSKIIYMFKFYTLDLSIIVIAFFIGVITIFGTIFLTLDFLSGISPVKSLNRIHKSRITKIKLLKADTKMQKFYSIYAKRDLRLNKFKSLLTILLLSISITVCLSVFVYINDYNYDIMSRPVKGVEVTARFRNDANALGLELSYDYVFGLSQEVVEELKSIEGVNGIMAKHFEGKGDYLLAVNKDMLTGYLDILHAPIINRFYYDCGDVEKNYQDLLSLGLDKDLAFLGKHHAKPCVETYGDYMFSFLEQHLAIGSINLKELREGNEVILCLPPFKANPEKYPIRFARRIIPEFKGRPLEYQENILKVGDTVTLIRIKPLDTSQDFYKAKADLSSIVLEQREVKIGGIIKKAGYLELPNGDYHKITDTPLVYVHNDAMAKWTGIKQYSDLSLILSDDTNDLDVEARAKELVADYNNVSVQSQTKFDEAVQRNRFQISFLHLPIIIVSSIISILTIWITIANNYQVKKRQFSLLRSIGLTKAQFNKILNFQAVFYGLSAGIIATIVTAVYSMFIYYQFYHGLRMYKWWDLVPWPLIPVFTLVSIALICFINNSQFKSDSDKSITENLRYTE